MPQFEHGLYEPSEDVRVFDGSEEEEDVEGSRLPLLIVLALLVLATFAGFVWLAYSEGVARGRSEAPMVTAEAGRLPPADQESAATPYKGFKIYEQPAPPDDDQAQDVSARGGAPTAVPAAKAPGEPAAKTVTPPAKPSAPVKTAAAAPATKLAPVPARAPMAAANTPPRQLAELAKAPAKTQAQPPGGPAGAVASSGLGTYVLQIGAYKSQAEADAAWTAYKDKHSTLLAGYAPNVMRADLGDKGIWYRLRIGGFSNKDAASALCDRLKADGGGCFLGR
jgi:cell division septation protein DedD